MDQTIHAPLPKPVHPKAPIKFRQHLLPPLLGVFLTFIVFGLLNSQWISAQAYYMSNRSQPAGNVVVTPHAPDKQSAQIQIPKIGVNAPVVYNEKSYQEQKIQSALQRGVVHYGTTALPGQAGNAVLLGHSSGQLWTPGEYKFVFTLLDRLSAGDTILLDYKGTRYIYKVTSTKVVPPSDISVIGHTETPTLTLITCTPVGTDKNRLIISARQVVPDPKTATIIPEEDRINPIGWSLPK